MPCGQMRIPPGDPVQKVIRHFRNCTAFEQPPIAAQEKSCKPIAEKERHMSRKIVAVNAGPRKGWNTDTLIMEAARGAESAGAQVEKFDLFRLERYTGCISCFGCKKEKFKGHCICRDGLTPVLDAIRGGIHRPDSDPSCGRQLLPAGNRQPHHPHCGRQPAGMAERCSHAQCDSAQMIRKNISIYEI